jgi:Tol biopolymer transport system component
MTLAVGSKLGPYEIVRRLGAGGMGEVFRAHDSRLKRDVALKVLPERFAADPDRLVRFEREAEVLAALNHPSIAQIHGVEERDQVRALVLELVEGETLAEQIERGPLPLEDALPIARQIAEAIEAAHAHAITHRDIKPANIAVRPDGSVKVLDFGLAAVFAFEPTGAVNPALTHSPTHARATQDGVILGTAAYMSPEQARGRVVDHRTDVWAFGAVLYEMLTGTRAFAGHDFAEILSGVLTKEPPFDALPVRTPPAITHLLRRCLEKDPKRRLQHIGEARIVIEDALSGALPWAPQSPARGAAPLRTAILAAAALMVAVLTVAAALSLQLRPRRDEAGTIRFALPPPDGWTLSQQVGSTGSAAGSLAVSPDGRHIAFSATRPDGSSSQLWVRSLDTLVAQPLAGTEGGRSPFWSPDGQFLGFFADGKLKRLDLSGAPPTVVAEARDGLGGTWNRDDVIIFAPRNGAPLQRVSAAGGASTAATAFDGSDIAHLRPLFLPDGRHFLYRALVGPGARSGPIYLASIDSVDRTVLFESDSTNVLYSEGHLLFLREMTVMAQPFDVERLALRGEAFPLVDQVQISQTTAPQGFFSASPNGVLVYQPGSGSGRTQLEWIDRSGTRIASLGEPADYGYLELSADRTRASVSVLNGAGRDIWVWDLERGVRSRFTFFDRSTALQSIWSPDGRQIVFASDRSGRYELYQAPANGSGSARPLAADQQPNFPLSWSPDGRSILYRTTGGETGGDLFVLPAAGGTPYAFANTPFREMTGQFSPDGRWVAYTSDESGRVEVYVVPFPGPGGKWQVSTGGGDHPRWRGDSAELFYLDPSTTLMAVPIDGTGAELRAGVAARMFRTRATLRFGYPYDVSADGQQFLINQLPERASSPPIEVVVNWLSARARE